MSAVGKKKKDGSGFGERLKAIRIAAGLTQEQLAERVGMKPTNITRLEKGGRTPGWDTVLKLAEALNVSLDEFKEE